MALKDRFGNELRKGDFVMLEIPITTNFIIGHIAEIERGGETISLGTERALKPDTIRLVSDHALSGIPGKMANMVIRIPDPNIEAIVPNPILAKGN